MSYPVVTLSPIQKVGDIVEILKVTYYLQKKVYNNKEFKSTIMFLLLFIQSDNKFF